MHPRDACFSTTPGLLCAGPGYGGSSQGHQPGPRRLGRFPGASELRISGEQGMASPTGEKGYLSQREQHLQRGEE